MKNPFKRKSKNSITLKFSHNDKINSIIKYYMKVYADFLNSDGHKESVLIGRLVEIKHTLKYEYNVPGETIDFAEEIVELKHKAGVLNV